MASRGRVRDRHTEDVLLADQVSSDDDVGTEEDEAVFDATILASGGKHSRDLEDAAAELIELGEPPAKRARIETALPAESPPVPAPAPVRVPSPSPIATRYREFGITVNGVHVPVNACRYNDHILFSPVDLLKILYAHGVADAKCKCSERTITIDDTNHRALIAEALGRRQLMADVHFLDGLMAALEFVRRVSGGRGAFVPIPSRLKPLPSVPQTAPIRAAAPSPLTDDPRPVATRDCTFGITVNGVHVPINGCHYDGQILFLPSRLREVLQEHGHGHHTTGLHLERYGTTITIANRDHLRAIEEAFDCKPLQPNYRLLVGARSARYLVRRLSGGAAAFVATASSSSSPPVEAENDDDDDAAASMPDPLLSDDAEIRVEFFDLGVNGKHTRVPACHYKGELLFLPWGLLRALQDLGAAHHRSAGARVGMKRKEKHTITVSDAIDRAALTDLLKSPQPIQSKHRLLEGVVGARAFVRRFARPLEATLRSLTTTRPPVAPPPQPSPPVPAVTRTLESSPPGQQMDADVVALNAFLVEKDLPQRVRDHLIHDLGMRHVDHLRYLLVVPEYADFEARMPTYARLIRDLIENM